MNQCEAITLPTTYAPAHRCLKTHNLVKVQGRTVCPHHRRALPPPRPKR